MTGPNKFTSAIPVLAGPARIVYASLDQPGLYGKYNITVAIGKDTLAILSKVNSAVQAAYDSGKRVCDSCGTIIPQLGALKTPLSDGDLEHPNNLAFQGCMALSASSRKQPDTYDLQRNKIPASEVKPGDYVRIYLEFSFYYVQGNMGIRAELVAVQKVRDGSAFGSAPALTNSVNTRDVFDDGFDGKVDELL